MINPIDNLIPLYLLRGLWPNDLPFVLVSSHRNLKSLVTQLPRGLFTPPPYYNCNLALGITTPAAKGFLLNLPLDYKSHSNPQESYPLPMGPVKVSKKELSQSNFPPPISTPITVSIPMDLTQV